MLRKRISVVGTVHEESGQVTLNALLAILERLRPEVIFLEIPPDAFPPFAAGIRANLESTAARRYRDIRSVELVPVDRATPDDHFFSASAELFKRVEQVSPEYRNLIDHHSHQVATFGFPYLNSDRCAEQWELIYGAVYAALLKIGNSDLLSHYGFWRQTIRLRDQAMAQGIGSYCARESFSQGVLLVGSAHRRSLRDLTPEERGPHSDAFDWDMAIPLQSGQPLE